MTETATATATPSRFRRVTADEAKATFRITCSTWGREKEGKTRFAFTFPEPIYYINIDRDNNDLILTTFPDKDIREARVSGDVDLDPDSPRKMLVEFHNVYVEALKDLKAEGHGTLVIDTFTVVRSLINAVMHTEARQKRADAKGIGFDDVKNSQLDYQGANKRTRQYIQAVTLNAPGVNLVLVNKAKQAYQNGQAVPGVYEAEIWPEVPSLVGISVHQYKDGNKYMSLIESCNANPKITGVPIPNLDYATLRGMLLGE